MNSSEEQTLETMSLEQSAVSANAKVLLDIKRGTRHEKDFEPIPPMDTTDVTPSSRLALIQPKNAKGENVETIEEAEETTENENISVTVFPNPFQKTFSLYYFLPVSGGQYELTVFDVNGRMVMKQPLNSGYQTINIDASALDAGLYNYKITGTKVTPKTGKLIAY